MYHQERLLQRLRLRFDGWLPWLCNATKANVSIVASGGGNAFTLIAKWPADGEYRKVYDAAAVLRQGRVVCVKDYAREFVAGVLKARGVM